MSVRAKLRKEDGAAAVGLALIVGLLAILVFAADHGLRAVRPCDLAIGSFPEDS